MEVVLQEKRLWRFVFGREAAQPSATGTGASPTAGEGDPESKAQRSDLALAIILFAADSSCKASAHQLWCSQVA